MKSHLVRVGQFGQIGRFRSELGIQNRLDLGLNQKVICRTARGLEVGEFLATDENCHETPDGDLLRTMTQQDLLLAERLERNKLAAINECQKLIDQRNLPVAILDAEQTFDGQSLYFYFAGEISAEVDELTAQLAETYDAQVKFSEFAETLSAGCGPACGTSDGAGCGTTTAGKTGCGSCGLKSSCSS